MPDEFFINESGIRQGRAGLSRLLRFALDAVFPVYCVGCNREGNILCANCRSAIYRAPLLVCSACGRFSPGGITHSACRTATPLAALIAPYPYANPLVRKLIKNFKYRGSGESKKIVENFSASSVNALRLMFPAAATVVAMPLHPRRERERGFNQSEIIGRAVAEALGFEFDAGLVRRVRRTDEQARLPFHERAENCANAFYAKPASGTIVLVDDVVTTGATMKAAALALRAAGAERVVGFALAHG
jgi:ComF family protein